MKSGHLVIAYISVSEIRSQALISNLTNTEAGILGNILVGLIPSWLSRKDLCPYKPGRFVIGASWMSSNLRHNKQQIIQNLFDSKFYGNHIL